MSKLPRGFSGFVNGETILVNDPVFSRLAVQEYVTHPKEKLNKLKKIGHLCDGKHDLDEYKSFKERGLKEKSRFLFEQKLFHGCFSQIFASHNARNCSKTKECKVYKNLHGYQIEKPKGKLENSREEKHNEQKDFHCATANMSSEVVSMCVVPVMVRHKLSNRVVKT